MGEQVVCVDAAIKAKLQSIGNELYSDDRQSAEMYNVFGRYLGDRFNPEIVPMGYVMAYQLVIFDLSMGVSGFPENPIPTRLAGYPLGIYMLMSAHMVRIAELVFPADFAAEVKSFHDEVEASRPK